MTTSSAYLEPGEGLVLSTAQLHESGYTRSGVQAAMRAGQLVSLRHGRYWAPPAEAAKRPELVFRARIAAALLDAADAGRELVLSGPAAAVWWGLPWVGMWPESITVCGAADAGSGARGLLRRTGEVPDDAITQHRGALLTSVTRTVLDCARMCPDRTSLVIADAALHRGLASPAGLAEELERMAGRRGIARARWCARHADGRSESPGESISRFAMIQAGLPMPELQVEFTLPGGRVCRVDFYWCGCCLVGEFDGITKYFADSQDPEVARKRLAAEKRREDALRAQGLGILRWTWNEAWRPSSLIARLRTLICP